MAQGAGIVAVVLVTEWAQDQPCHKLQLWPHMGLMMSHATIIVAVVLVTEWVKMGENTNAPDAQQSPGKQEQKTIQEPNCFCWRLTTTVDLCLSRYLERVGGLLFILFSKLHSHLRSRAWRVKPLTLRAGVDWKQSVLMMQERHIVSLQIIIVWVILH